jgi:hypothetical protein
MGCCAGVLVLGGAPRIAIILLEIFTDKMDIAFDSFIVAFLGFLLLPYTTVFYALAYAPIRGVTGFGWFLVILGFVIDITSYTSGEYSRRRRYSAA